MPSAAEQQMIDQAVAAALAEAQRGLVVAASKPQMISDLRKTWRSSAEHKAAQVKRFVSALAAVVVLQLVSDASTGTNPLSHFTDVKTAWYYLLPFALVAWRQVHPALTASQVDSAPGVTIVPAQVAVSAPDSPPAVSVVPDDAPVAGDGFQGAPYEGDAAP